MVVAKMRLKSPLLLENEGVTGKMRTYGMVVYNFRELERLVQSGIFERTALADDNLSKAIQQLPQNTEGVFKDSYVGMFI